MDKDCPAIISVVVVTVSCGSRSAQCIIYAKDLMIGSCTLLDKVHRVCTGRQQWVADFLHVVDNLYS